MERKIDKPLALYGKGRLGKLAEEVFSGIPHVTFDKDSLQTVSEGERKEFLVGVCVSTSPYIEIWKSLKAVGFVDICPIWDIIQAYSITGVTNGWSWIASPENFHNLTSVICKWEDGWSWYHHQSFLIWHSGARWDVPLHWAPVVNNQWAPPEVVSAVIKKMGRAAAWKISTEPEISTLAAIAERKKVVRLDDEQGYVRFHCEGKELESLHVNMDHFRKYRPIIGVTVYHTEDGVWKIERLLMEQLTDYKFYFRLHCYMGTGAVMYCIPNEHHK